MKRMLSLCAAALCLTLALTPTALAADFEPAVPNAKVCYPTAIVRSDDGTELKKIYDLSPEDDPAGIPRSDFRQDGFHYTLTDLLKQELPVRSRSKVESMMPWCVSVCNKRAAVASSIASSTRIGM